MPSRTPKRKDAVQTRAALLQAAAEVFARHGFKDSNVREICDRAGVNLGSVSHYFGSKAMLYREVLILMHRELLSREPHPVRFPGQKPAAALMQWIRYLLRFMLLRRVAHPQAGQLISWEISQPSGALDEFVTKIMRPIWQSVEEIVAELLGSADSPELRSRCTSFVLGLCVVREMAREVFHRFGQPVPKTGAELDALAESVWGFAIGGIESMKGPRRMAGVVTPEK